MRFLVLGAGVSGISAANYLAKKGGNVTLSDPALKSLTHLEISGGISQTESQTPDLLNGIDTLVVSPGIPLSIPLIEAAQKQEIRICSEIEIALSDFVGTVVGVTGTNGKSTTTAMTTHLLNNLGYSAVSCGNFGLPPTSLLLNNANYSYWVIELSSYQLELAKNVRPRVTIFTNFSGDHQARHGSLENYFRAKWNLPTSMASGLLLMDGTVKASCAEFGCNFPKGVKTKIIDSPITDLDFSMTCLRTLHDRLNASFAASAVGFLAKVEPTVAARGLKDFATLAHRFELVGLVNGHEIINDSKATNVGSVISALKNISRPCILLLGGLGKGEPFNPILEFRDKIERVIAFGRAGPTVATELGGQLPVQVFESFNRALIEGLVPDLKELKRPILFSPGCASFDEFQNFEKRGDFFKSFARAFIGTK